jgi:Radical SAM superfamily
LNNLQKHGISLDFALTSRCPLECRYCTVKKTHVAELSSVRWGDVAASFARLRQIDLVSLEGGEPFLRPDLPAILAGCLESAGAVKIVTSGTVPLEALPDRLLHHPGFYLELSLDGPREVHDFLRDGSWERAWTFLADALERGIRIRLRSVISRHNLFIYESWLAWLDGALEPFGRKLGFTFDTIIAPEALAHEGGEFSRAGFRTYGTRGLLPSPSQIWALFQNVKNRPLRNLVFLQNEPIRGCGAVSGGFISFDPSGFFSLCCEAPRGMGTILRMSAEECLSVLDSHALRLPCIYCPYRRVQICNGCWTGQKCGMVGHFGYADCRALHASMAPDRQQATLP